jgi:hypothetical protein
MQRRNTCASEDAGISDLSMSRATAFGALKQNDNRKKRRSLISTVTSETDLKQCADKNLGTKCR